MFHNILLKTPKELNTLESLQINFRNTVTKKRICVQAHTPVIARSCKYSGNNVIAKNPHSLSVDSFTGLKIYHLPNKFLVICNKASLANTTRAM